MRVACLLFFALLSTASWAMGPHGEIESLSELAALPAYCKGTQVTRDVAHDPKPISEYQAIYGAAYSHLHHYCWALNTENHQNEMDENSKNFQYGVILDNIKYFLDNSPLTFSLIPQIYNTKARILFKMHRDAEAIDVLFKLTQIKPSYASAYALLGDHYQRINDKNNAIKYYEQGLINTHKGNAEFFIWKIKKLDKDYKAPLIDPIPKSDESVQNSFAEQSAETNDRSTSTKPLEQNQLPATPEISPLIPTSDSASRHNPYCRFCP